MNDIKAKSVISDTFWILQENNKKIGEVIKIPSGKYRVSVAGKPPVTHSTLDKLNFTFIDQPEPMVSIKFDVAGYPTVGEVCNPMWDVVKKMPLYTKSADSKSYYAAGYYKVDGNYHFCPKLIFLERVDFSGPFKSNPTQTQFDRLFKTL